jgi:hypothetical protein
MTCSESVGEKFCVFVGDLFRILSHFEKYHRLIVNWGQGHKFIMLSFRGHSKVPPCRRWLDLHHTNYVKNDLVKRLLKISLRIRNMFKDLVTPNISACRKIDNVLLIKVFFIS